MRYGCLCGNITFTLTLIVVIQIFKTNGTMIKMLKKVVYFDV